VRLVPEREMKRVINTPVSKNNVGLAKIRESSPKAVGHLSCFAKERSDPWLVIVCYVLAAKPTHCVKSV
jgi:hypothetical protein